MHIILVMERDLRELIMARSTTHPIWEMWGIGEAGKENLPTGKCNRDTFTKALTSLCTEH